MSFLKVLRIVIYARELLTLAGQLLVGLRNIPKVDQPDMSQDSSNPIEGVEDEKPAEEIQNEFPFMRGQ